MFVAIITFPPIKEGKDDEFREWFSWSNREFSKERGFIRRKLLKPLQGGNYTAILEHESRETFMAMHDSPVHDEAGKRVQNLFEGNPAPALYEVIVE